VQTNVERPPILLGFEFRGRTRQSFAAAYDIVMPAAMAKHPWNFCTRQAQLPVEAEAPKFGFSYRYRVPTEPRCL